MIGLRGEPRAERFGEAVGELVGVDERDDKRHGEAMTRSSIGDCDRGGDIGERCGLSSGSRKNSRSGEIGARTVLRGDVDVTSSLFKPIGWIGDASLVLVGVVGSLLLIDKRGGVVGIGSV
jgi:hypothetical protein